MWVDNKIVFASYLFGKDLLLFLHQSLKWKSLIHFPLSEPEKALKVSKPLRILPSNFPKNMLFARAFPETQ